MSAATYGGKELCVIIAPSLTDIHHLQSRAVRQASIAEDFDTNILTFREEHAINFKCEKCAFRSENRKKWKRIKHLPTNGVNFVFLTSTTKKI